MDMTQSAAQRRASDQVGAWLAAHDKNPQWLATVAKADAGTIGDFLGGTRWPKLGTQGRIEKAVGWPPGSIRQVGNGAEPESVGATLDAGLDLDPPAGARRLGNPEDDLVEFQIEGVSGVRAVVKGPIRDLEELQAAVSKLIAGMQAGEVATSPDP